MAIECNCTNGCYRCEPETGRAMPGEDMIVPEITALQKLDMVVDMLCRLKREGFMASDLDKKLSKLAYELAEECLEE